MFSLKNVAGFMSDSAAHGDYSYIDHIEGDVIPCESTQLEGVVKPNGMYTQARVWN